MRVDPVFGEDGAPSTLADPGWANTLPPGFDGESAIAPSRLDEPVARARRAAPPRPRARRSARRRWSTRCALLPPHALLWRDEDTTPYECDGLTAYRERPLAVALPETEAQVAAMLRGLPPAGRAGGRARRGHRAVGRRDAARARA